MIMVTFPLIAFTILRLYMVESSRIISGVFEKPGRLSIQ
jgi:hypothetical protein